MAAAAAGVRALNGYTDTVPDIFGRLGSPIGLAIFTEGNHFPTLLSSEVIETFRARARGQTEYAALALDNIVVVTLPQPIIVDMLLGHGISLGNLSLEVTRGATASPMGASHSSSLCSDGASGWISEPPCRRRRGPCGQELWPQCRPAGRRQAALRS